MADPYYRLRARVRERSIEMVQYAADALAHAMDQTVPVKTGKLKASQRVRISAPSADDRVSVSISYDSPYAGATDQGRREVEIFARGKAMRFQWDNAPYDPPRFHGPGVYSMRHVIQPEREGTNWYGQWLEPEIWQTQLQRAERDLTT